jgi:hypothetical protein
MTMLGGLPTAGNRDERQVKIADALEQPMECGLVRQRAGKQCLVAFQVRQFYPPKPFRPVWIQMALDLDLALFRHGCPPRF